MEALKLSPNFTINRMIGQETCSSVSLIPQSFPISNGNFIYRKMSAEGTVIRDFFIGQRSSSS